MTRRRPCTTASCLVGLQAPLIAAAGPQVHSPVEPPRVPFDARASVVMPSGVVAGMPVSIVQFSTHLSLAVSLEQAASAWSGSAPVVRASGGPWQTLSTRAGNDTLTLQVREVPGGGAAGFLSRWGRPLSDGGGGRGLIDQVLPAGARVLQSVGHRDGATEALTVTAVSDGRGEQVLADLARRLAARGFREEAGGWRRDPAPGVRAAHFRGDAAQMAVTLDFRTQPGTLVITLRTVSP